ncbi:phospho-sugar glycosidase domain-containing protein, partial [Bacillus sp. B-TM1]
YASEDELEKLGNLNRYMLQLKVNFVDEATEVEKRASLQELHVRRGDITEYMVRSTEVRKKYKDYDFPVRESVLQERGQVVIGNNSFGKYKGELQIILKEMPIDERKNIVGTIAEEELFLLDYVRAWTQFTCVE